jgi:carboxypeptidase C (cathepsin A)
MRNLHIPACFLFCCLLFGDVLWSATVRADEPNAGDAIKARLSEAIQKKKDAARNREAKTLAATIPDAAHKPVLTSHNVTIAGRRVNYVAETGMLPLLAPDGTVRASVFYVAYVKQGEERAEQRPLTFCFNGGPGSSSVWLHLGGLGPRRVKLNDVDPTRPAPFGLADNEFSILDVTDLVFIDPVATGYSRPAGESKPQQFFGEGPDIESVGEFIRLWTTRQGRWLSPKFVCGESYGVFRAAGLVQYLRSSYRMSLNGLILVSGAVDFGTLSGDVGCQLFLPAYTATAHFHQKLAPELQANLPKALAEARQFMRTEYASALFQGASLPADERARVAAKLARLTGLPARVIEDNNLRIDGSAFRKELLRDRGLIVGRFDARITGRDADTASRQAGFDPSLSAVDGAFAAAMNAYVRGELKFEDDLPYKILGSVGPWSFGSRDSSPGNVAQQFASEMNENPHLRVLVLSGRCDLACPVDCIRHNFDHLRLNPAARGNITYAEYASGHMMYLDLPDLRQMQKDLERFISPR